MSSYWITREAKQKEALMKSAINSLDKAMAKRYLTLSRKLALQIENVYLAMMKDIKDGTVLVSDLYKYQRFYDLLNDLNESINELGLYQETIFSKDFIKVYNESKKITREQFNLGNVIDERKAEQAVKSVWCKDGLNYSDRIWKDKTSLFNTIKQGLFDVVASGGSADDLKKTVMDRCGVSYSNSSRLIRTEINHINNKAGIDSYEEAGINKVQWLHNHSCKCEDCGRLEGKIFDINKAPNIPFHP